jgi:hypothetical protein
MAVWVELRSGRFICTILRVATLTEAHGERVMPDKQHIPLDEIVPYFDELEDPRSAVNLQHPLVKELKGTFLLPTAVYETWAMSPTVAYRQYLYPNSPIRVEESECPRFPPANQPLPILIIADDLLPRIAPRHYMINGALKFDPKSSWHAESVSASSDGCQATNQKPRLTPRSCPVLGLMDTIGHQLISLPLASLV